MESECQMFSFTIKIDWSQPLKNVFGLWPSLIRVGQKSLDIKINRAFWGWLSRGYAHRGTYKKSLGSRARRVDWRNAPVFATLTRHPVTAFAFTIPLGML